MPNRLVPKTYRNTQTNTTQLQNHEEQDQILTHMHMTTLTKEMNQKKKNEKMLL